jgi:hypothetical protein
MTEYPYDVFISHASEDKKQFVRPLVELLTGLGVRVWFDEATLSAGDRLSEKVQSGLQRSRFGVVVISKHFMLKKWTNQELAWLVSSPERIIQIWHGVDEPAVRAFNEPLADMLALTSVEGSMHEVALGLLKRMGIHRERDTPSIEHYHGSVRVSPTGQAEHYLEALQVGGVFRVPRGEPLRYADAITNSSPRGRIDSFNAIPAPVEGLDAQLLRGGRFLPFELIGPEDASVMSICGLMHATKQFTPDDGYVAVRLPYFTKFVTLMFDYSGLDFELGELGTRIDAQSAEARARKTLPTLSHWQDRRMVVLQDRDVPGGSNPMIVWGKWLGRGNPAPPAARPA